MLLRQLRREYTRYTQDGYYYSYHEADIYLDTLMQTIVHPLSQIAHVQPTGVASLAADLLLDVGGLSELVYPSSDRWEDYCSTVFALWIQAISAQKERSPEDVAKGYEWFDIWELCEWQETLGHDVLRALSTQFQRAGERNNAFVVYP
ncbi:hypothetical protein [Pluralibacter sp.]|uniref:hypothetical protein n=1 Tax=Pluralibacter sp. TaxID=1920032 RepID=UPI0025D9CB0D|nr:hypothetical protein [Pluralibacter sp.]MBV8042712.1 hypothetical protein [Pluralibacter sp.]